MGTKTTLACITLLMMGGAYWWGQRHEPIEADPDPVILSDETVTGMMPPPADGAAVENLATVCPEMQGSEVLGFTDAHTPETLATVTAYQQAEQGEDTQEKSVDSPLIDVTDLNNDGHEDFIALSGKECDVADCLAYVFIQREDGGYDGSGFALSRKGGIHVTNEMINGMRKLIVTDKSDKKQLWQWSGKGYARYGVCLN